MAVGKRRMVCADCKIEQNLKVAELHRAARPQCIRCGGRLDLLGMSLSNRKGEDGIVYPNAAASEFEIQAYIYNRLQGMGVSVRGEVPSRTRGCRFDLVIFKNKTAILVIEVKS